MIQIIVENVLTSRKREEEEGKITKREVINYSDENETSTAKSICTDKEGQ